VHHAPVSTTPAANFATISAGVVHTSGKFATSVNENGPNGIIMGLGETDQCRKPEVENLVTLSL
jgi:hypothetical protein